MDTKLYICAMMRNEHDYIREWVEHHIKCGVSHFYLYDNESSHDYENEIGDYIEKGYITITSWPDVNPLRSGRNNKQIDAYNHFINSNVGSSDEWCAFIDLDEFIGPSCELLEFLDIQPHTVSGVFIVWKLFNANGHVKKQPKLIEAYTEETQKVTRLKQGKTISRLSDITCMKTCHGGSVKQTYVNTLGRPATLLKNSFILNPTNQNVILHHYFTKSGEDGKVRLKRGAVTMHAQKDRNVGLFFAMNKNMEYLREELVKELKEEELPSDFKSNRPQN